MKRSIVALVLASVGVAAQNAARAPKSARSYTAPRTPWGDPDLQGTYTYKYEQSTPLERPDEFVGVRSIAGLPRRNFRLLRVSRNQLWILDCFASRRLGFGFADFFCGTMRDD